MPHHASVLPPTRQPLPVLRRFLPAVVAGVLGVLLAVPTGQAATTDGSAADVQPSSAMHTQDPAGWTKVMGDDFTGSSLHPRWYAYDAQPGGDTGACWDPSHVSVSGGSLVLSTYADPGKVKPCPSTFADQVSGGINSNQLAQTYGRYSARVSMDRAHGVTFAAGLYTVDGSWPPEIDIVEGVGDYPTAISSNHYVGGCAANHCITRATTAVDWSVPHTWTLDWAPGRIEYYLDGRSYGVITSNVPAKPMWPAFQTQTWTCTASPIWTCPDKSTPTTSAVRIDWIVVYKRS